VGALEWVVDKNKEKKIVLNIINRNFLGINEFLALCNAFLAHHLHSFGNAKTATSSYFSSGIFNEFIQLMVRRVWSTIVAEVISVKYNSLIVDCTPGITRLYHLVFAVRYVNNRNLMNGF